MRFRLVLAAFAFFMTFAPAAAGPPIGYYREPALHKDTIVFVAEGDLWQVPTAGGPARRLTSHTGNESQPAISPDGTTVAFTGQYEGAGELYTIPLSGGAPKQWTYHGGAVNSVGWTPDGKILYATKAFSGLRSDQLAILDPKGSPGQQPVRVPLAQAADGCYSGDGKTLFFTRLPFQGSHTKRYKGGTAQNLWRFADGDAEAAPLTADYAGTSRQPMWHDGRVYFASDRDGTMNLWSMTPDGKDLKQHTRHAGWDIGSSMSLHNGRVVYQLGADLHLFDIASGNDKKLAITLDSDFDQTRERWIERPAEYMTSAHIAPDGGRVAITARGRVFVAPHKSGRLVEVTRTPGVRYRDARFMPDGKTILTFSDESGEIELWSYPANGVGKGEQLTRDGNVLRWEGVPSPDGHFIAHRDKNQRLFLYDVRQKQDKKIDESTVDEFRDLRWSPDSRWLTYGDPAGNTFYRIKLYSVEDGKTAFVTTDRYHSHSPAFSADGKWLYFLSDRNLRTVVPSPWGNYQPEPFFDKKTQIFQVALTKGQRSPFTPPDELNPEKPDKKEPPKKSAAKPGDTDKLKSEDKPKVEKEGEPDKPTSKDAPEVEIDLNGIAERLERLPVPAGNYAQLSVNDKGLFWTSRPTGEIQSSLLGLAIGHDSGPPKTVSEGIRDYELSQDGKKLLLVRSGGGGPGSSSTSVLARSLSIIDANPVPAPSSPIGPGRADAGASGTSRPEVNLSGWTMSVQPREEWRQMFVDAWRLERDYFYDRGMHGLDWPAIRKKYEPLVDRVSNRAELSDLIAQMVSELSALHIFVGGGDQGRPETPRIQSASLGVELSRDEAAGGYRVGRIPLYDRDEPDQAPPFARPEVNIREGDIIEQINGVSTLSVPNIHLLLRNQVDKQVLMRVKAKAGQASRDVIVKPIGAGAAMALRHNEWEYTRRAKVEKDGAGAIGYVHLRAMSGRDFDDFARSYYPVFNRQALIIDVRHNGGGNIDSWVLSRLMRKPWFYWNQRIGQSPKWNMHYAFRGHMVVLCDERTASDGEAFSEGFRRLGLGKVIGTRTWGGEIWLTSSNSLVDRGIATAAEFGVYGPEGTWLIEGHGVEPDIVVDNLPHSTFKGEDAQLTAALAHLKKRLQESPVPAVPLPPKFPDKSLKGVEKK